jgi:acetolactate synthase-1/2/3 large subunit
LKEIDRQLNWANWDSSRHTAWLAWCKERVALYPVVLPKHRVFNGHINSYHFIEELFRRLAADDVVVCGNGTACIVPFQAGQLRRGQRMFSNSGAASMGHDLPAAIGAAIGREGKRIVCLAGDGSIQLNIQELQTVVHHQLPVKIFILNNSGYLSIRTTQRNYFNRFVGESAKSGVSFPDMVKLATAYGLSAMRISQSDFIGQIEEVLSQPGPALAEVMLDPDQTFEPRSSSRQLPDGRIVSAPLEDMFPFLEKDELRENMLIPLAEA